MEGKAAEPETIRTVSEGGVVSNVLSSLRGLRIALFSIYILPLFVIAYLYLQYLYPMFTATGKEMEALGLSAMLTFLVVLSVLGLALIAKAARTSGDSLAEMNKRMGVLLTTAKQFGETGYVDTLLDSVAASVKDLLDAEASSLLLYDEGGALRFEYVEGPAARELKGKIVKPGEGITGWAASECRPVIVNDVENDPRFAHRFDKDSGFKTKSILCVPLMFSGKRLGMIEAINKQGGQGFTGDDQRALVALAEQAAAAIYRSRFEEDMKSDFVHVMEILVTAMDNHLPEKKGHARRAARYAVKLAKGLGLGEEDVRKVYFGALLHDVGLLKFNMQEYVNDNEKYKLHPAAGSDMVKKITQWADVSVIVRDHHERYDGSGYPSGLMGKDISLGGRIVALAESFDVMTSTISYRPAREFKDVALEIKSLAGWQFDPDVVSVFVKTFKEEDAADA